ncbi:unnamed protein product [Vitrella brassicaformis CCMP3155]|uniref:GH16 domain-containing protein n=2 Tax=Vitrella brassicaformis TaxID=1169539 RepID=A0A0G4EL77_VITBC|nr:unnamed protein product [Vitrella brassicaformis CCMP3155]|eukprot:CEL97707.1 unnamed protein product [Vitrella brassicaformis CCMP3155]
MQPADHLCRLPPLLLFLFAIGGRLPGIAGQCEWSVSEYVGTGTGDCGREYDAGEVVALTGPSKYGRYEARMLPNVLWADGVVLSFILWYQDSDKVPGTPWGEIDYQIFLGGPHGEKGEPLQTNIVLGYVWNDPPGLGLHEQFYGPPGYPKTPEGRDNEASKGVKGSWHTIAIEWTPEHVEWWFDGRRLRRCPSAECCSTATVPSLCEDGALMTNLNAIPSMNVRMSMWPVNPKEPWAATWSGLADPESFPLVAFVDYVTFYSYDQATKSFVFDDVEVFDYEVGLARTDANLLEKWSLPTGVTFDVNWAEFGLRRTNIVSGSVSKHLALTLAKKGENAVPAAPLIAPNRQALPPNDIDDTLYPNKTTLPEAAERYLDWREECEADPSVDPASGKVLRIPGKVFQYGMAQLKAALTPPAETADTSTWAVDACKAECIARLVAGVPLHYLSVIETTPEGTDETAYQCMCLLETGAAVELGDGGSGFAYSGILCGEAGNFDPSLTTPTPPDDVSPPSIVEGPPVLLPGQQLLLLDGGRRFTDENFGTQLLAVRIQNEPQGTFETDEALQDFATDARNVIATDLSEDPEKVIIHSISPGSAIVRFVVRDQTAASLQSKWQTKVDAADSLIATQYTIDPDYPVLVAVPDSGTPPPADCAVGDPLCTPPTPQPTTKRPGDFLEDNKDEDLDKKPDITPEDLVPPAIKDGIEQIKDDTKETITKSTGWTSFAIAAGAGVGVLAVGMLILWWTGALGKLRRLCCPRREKLLDKGGERARERKTETLRQSRGHHQPAHRSPASPQRVFV